jgi:PLD-like domain
MDPYPLIDHVIGAHLAAFKKPGVLTVRPGYKVIAGQTTSQPAIVATVEHKGAVAPAQQLPATIGSYPTDVRQASAAKALRVHDPAAFARVQTPHTGVVDHPFERDAQTGKPLAPVPQHTSGKTKIEYTGPSGVSLEPVKKPMTIVCHVSPDAGFAQLKAFLSDIEKQLTVSMYEFGSHAILQTLLAGMKGQQKLSMVLDWPFGESPSDNQVDDETHATLAKALGSRLSFAWAAEDRDPAVTGWVFPSAYHIKVAVKDHHSFWLSSGNWNPSNQPDIDPFNPHLTAAQKTAMLETVAHSDRDWHVIVTEPGLAQTLEAYLQHDLQVASTVQATKPVAMPKLPTSRQATAPGKWVPSFKPLTIEGEMLVSPLLTPDTKSGDYVKGILQLIESARHSLYIQTQYIELPASGSNDAGIASLVSAVDAKIKAGLDVRIIVSEFETGEHSEYIERLQHAGFDVTKMKIQTGVHNKGFVVDSTVVAVGSQNWSSSGVSENRDATLIIHDERAAKYFEQVFVHDWETLARPAHSAAAPAVA